LGSDRASLIYKIISKNRIDSLIYKIISKDGMDNDLELKGIF
jgi:hypothetical protein